MPETSFAARHTCDSPEWYTPQPYVEAAREVLGAIDLDPASHEEANRTVQATQYFTEADNGLTQRWFGRVFVNPPGGLVVPFWYKFISGEFAAGIWIGYSLEQFQTLQSVGPASTPLDGHFCVPKRRIAFVENEAKRTARIAKATAAGWTKINKASQPSHGNYISYMGPSPTIFANVFRQFGQVVLR